MPTPLRLLPLPVSLLSATLLIACGTPSTPAPTQAAAKPAVDRGPAAGTPNDEDEPEDEGDNEAQDEADDEDELDDDDDRGTELDIVEGVDRPLDAALAQKLSEDAAAVAKGMEEASVALAAGNDAEAKKALAAARKGLDSLYKDRPTAELAVELWHADQTLELALAEQPLETVPLLVKLTRVDFPVFDSDEVAARHKERTTAQPDSLQPADKAADLELIDANLIYEEVDLPIATTHLHLLAAQRLVDEGKTEEARGVVDRAIASFEVIRVVEQAPEFRARQMVWDADTAFAAGEVDQAKGLLATASGLLEPIAQSKEDPQAQKMAVALLAELGPLQKSLTAGDTAHGTTLGRLKRNVMSLARRTALRAVMVAHRDEERFALADGLMYMERAATEGLFDGDKGAGGALLMAEAMIASAVRSSPASAKPRIKDLSNRVKALLKLDEAKPRDAAKIKEAYRGVMFDLRMLMIDTGFAPIAARG